MTIQIEIPWPPSINHYYVRRQNGYSVAISKCGKVFRHAVHAAWLEAGHSSLTGDVVVMVMLNPPDNRKRDIDNLIKPTLDALQHAGAYKDDNQVCHLAIQRAIVKKPGRATVLMWAKGE